MESPGASKPRILLVDDEPDILQSLGAVLAFDIPEAHVSTAQDGREALAIIGRSKVDLVVTDYKMPHMDGLELVTRIHERWPSCDTIMMTAYPDPEISRQAVERGKIKKFLAKPIDPDVLVKAVSRLLPTPN